VVARIVDCPGKHPREPLTWYRLDELDPCRVLDASCWRCGPVSYELVSYGGAYAVRRTDRKPRAVFATPRVRRTQADEWWHALMLGAAT
jgi:hypothetical protein